MVSDFLKFQHGFSFFYRVAMAQVLFLCALLVFSPFNALAQSDSKSISDAMTACVKEMDAGAAGGMTALYKCFEKKNVQLPAKVQNLAAPDDVVEALGAEVAPLQPGKKLPEPSGTSVVYSVQDPAYLQNIKAPSSLPQNEISALEQAEKARAQISRFEKEMQDAQKNAPVALEEPKTDIPAYQQSSGQQNSYKVYVPSGKSEDKKGAKPLFLGR